MNEEEMIAWQDVLDEIAAGRSTTLQCPFCATAPLDVEEKFNGRTKISCKKCSKYIEGTFSGY